jgi:hypothetical protein
VVFAGLLATNATFSPSQQFQPPTYDQDPRLLILQRFFEDRGSPIDHLAKDFLLAADHYGLDWRLLPSISVIESGGGKEFTNNNIFGWDNGRTRFISVRAGIHAVAEKLSSSKIYRNKDLDEKLALYNPNAEYPALVKSVMARLASDEPHQPRTSRL